MFSKILFIRKRSVVADAVFCAPCIFVNCCNKTTLVDEIELGLNFFIDVIVLKRKIDISFNMRAFFRAFFCFKKRFKGLKLSLGGLVRTK